MALVTCPKCGTRNRVNEALTASLRPRCGRCGTPLDEPVAPPQTPVPQTVTDQTFDQLLRDADDQPVLIDCWADWCPPCRAIAPTIDQLAAEAQGRYRVAKLDVDSNPRTAGQYRVESIPTLLIFRKGQLVDRLVGLQPKATIAARLQSHL